MRSSGLDFTILEAGMIYGRGDHLVDHLSRSIQTIPIFATVGMTEKPIRPIPVGEMVDVLVRAVEGQPSNSTVAVVGGEQLLAKAQARMLAEGVAEAAPPTSALPEHMRPRLPFSDDLITAALPPRGGFGLTDLRFMR